LNKYEETPTPSTSKSKSNNGGESQRLRCPFPKCGFSTRRGVIGLKEHSTCHKRNISDDNDNDNDIKPLIPIEDKPLPPKKKKSKRGQLLRCSYPNCNYTTHWGMYSIRRHFKSIHTKKSTPHKSNTNNNNDSLNSNSSKIAIDSKNLPETNSNSKPLLRCSYANCDYETRYGMSKLRFHMKVHINQQQNKSKTHKNKSQNVLNINSKRLGTLLRCTKCQYKTKWGLATLKKHMKIHNREKPFKCDECDASYAQRYPLLVHKQQMHKHDNSIKQSKYDCNVCKKSFRNSYGLKRHQKIHKLTDSSYECPHENCFFKTHIPEIFQKHVVTHVLTEYAFID